MIVALALLVLGSPVPLLAIALAFVGGATDSPRLAAASLTLVLVYSAVLALPAAYFALAVVAAWTETDPAHKATALAGAIAAVINLSCPLAVFVPLTVLALVTSVAAVWRTGWGPPGTPETPP